MTAPSRVLVTGITGFIGSHVAIQLLEKGYEVVGTLRNPNRTDSIQESIAKHTKHTDRLSFAQAELMDAESWKQAMKGIEYVMHVASPISTTTPKDENEMIIPAREGTLNVLRAATEAGVKRVVITSSVAAISYNDARGSHAKFTEEDWTDIANPSVNAYIKSKTLAERAAWDFIRQQAGAPELATVNPSLVLGPVLEKDLGSSAVLVKRLLDGSFPALPKLGFPIVDVRSVADLHLLAMEKEEAAGERFIAGGAFMWMDEIAQILKEAYPSRKVPIGKLPNFLFRLMALFDAQTRSVLGELNTPRPVDISKAQNLLGWKPIAEKEAVLATAESLMKYGVI
ncbi:MAG: aldehyde reductase [Bacteroidota bacterium]